MGYTLAVATEGKFMIGKLLKFPVGDICTPRRSKKANKDCHFNPCWLCHLTRRILLLLNVQHHCGFGKIRHRFGNHRFSFLALDVACDFSVVVNKPSAFSISTTWIDCSSVIVFGRQYVCPTNKSIRIYPNFMPVSDSISF